MKISDLLSSTDVTADLVVVDKQQLLHELARRAGAVVDVLPDRISAELAKREALGSTGMGDGVALPHARFQEVKKPFGILVRLRKPIDFEAVDGQKVDLVFLLLLPEAQSDRGLGALACAARKLREPGVAAALRSARDGAELYRILAAS